MCTREVKKKRQEGWSGWRQVSGVVCCRRIPARVKVKEYNILRPTNDVCFEFNVTNKMTGGRTGCTKTEDVKSFHWELKWTGLETTVVVSDRVVHDKVTAQEQFGDNIKGERLTWF